MKPKTYRKCAYAFLKKRSDKNTAVSNFEMLRVSNNTAWQVGMIAPSTISKTSVDVIVISIENWHVHFER